MTLTVAQVRALGDTSLTDDALQLLIDAAYEAINQRLDPDDGAATELLTASGDRLMLSRPASEITTVQEHANGPAVRTLAATDYELLPSGQTLLRLSTGTTPAWSWWGRVRVDYVPRTAANLRDSVATQLVSLDTNTHHGLTQQTIGSYSESYGQGGASYKDQREAILSTLRPGGVLL